MVSYVTCLRIHLVLSVCEHLFSVKQPASFTHSAVRLSMMPWTVGRLSGVRCRQSRTRAWYQAGVALWNPGVVKCWVC